MRTVTLTYNVYTYEELSEEAKQKVNQWYLDNPFRAQDFDEIYTDDLGNLFPNSKLQLQFSLSSCQGDGLNIYGKLAIPDVLKVITDKVNYGNTFEKFWDYLTEHEKKTIEAYMHVCGRKVDLPKNDRYAYCVAYRIDFADDWIVDLEWQEYKNIQKDTIYKLEKLIADMFTELSRQYEEYGYKYFYEVDKEEVEAVCESNEWEFLEDGTFYVA